MSHAIFQNPLLSLEISMKTETIHISKQTIQVSSWNIDTNVLVVSRVFSRKKKNGFGEKVRQNRKSTRNVMARGKAYSLIRGKFRANWKAHHHWIRRLLKNTRQSFEKPPQHDLFLFLFQVGVRVTAILGSVRNLDQGPCRCLPTRNSDIATQRFARELTLFTQRALPSPPSPPWPVSRWVRTYVCTWNRLGACVLDVCVLPGESEYSTKSEHATLPRRI